MHFIFASRVLRIQEIRFSSKYVFMLSAYKCRKQAKTAGFMFTNNIKSNFDIEI